MKTESQLEEDDLKDVIRTKLVLNHRITRRHEANAIEDTAIKALRRARAEGRAFHLAELSIPELF